MTYNIADLLDTDDLPDGPVTIRGRIETSAIDGQAAGLDSLYLVEDPKHELGERAALSFWTETTGIPDIDPTDPVVLSMVGIKPEGDLPGVSFAEARGPGLSRGEEVIARVQPNYGTYDGEERLYLNVIDVLVREPETRVGKGYLRSNDPCPRRSYLKHTRHVYQQDPYEWDRESKRRESAQLRGDVAHRATELALNQHRERFEDGWTRDQVSDLCYELLEDEFSIREALLIVTGTKVGEVRDQIVDVVYQLFTDDRFSESLLDAESVETERPLDRRFGFQGTVDIVADGVPYDLKTTRNPSDETVENHTYQLELYLFVLALEQLQDGERLADILAEPPTGYLVYPNVEGDEVQYESVSLSEGDVAGFLAQRNEIITSGEAFAPPSTYNRDCDNCHLQHEEWINGPTDALPPACTYHCQNERRWPCYEINDGSVDSDCSLFETCTQRQQYRDPDRINHFERMRAGLQAERDARDRAAGVFDRLDPDLLAEAGRRIPDLELTGLTGGSVVQYESGNPVVPSFEAGDIVTIRPQGGDGSYRAIYYGNEGDIYQFQFLKTGSPPTAVIAPGKRYEAVLTRTTEKVDEQYLPYLDFAQRRNYPATPGGDADGEADTDGAIELDSVDELATYLDHKQVFVDLPVREERLSDIADIVEAIVTADVPAPDGRSTVSNTNARTLILGTTPALIDAAQVGQPTGDHYRMDGTSHGKVSIEASDGSHSVQQRLLSATSIVSSVSYATADWPTKGHTEVFHTLTDGDFVDSADDLPDRDHTDRFFDTLVLLGAEKVTEPEYRFLQDVADHVVAIGDRRRRGPEMLSDDAVGADLDVSQFETGFEHFASFPSNAGVSLQFSGDATPALQAYYEDDLWTPVDGTISFLNIEGNEATSTDRVSFRTTVRSAEGYGRRLVFDVTDTSANALEVIDMFSERERLDHTRFTVQAPVVIDDHSLYLREIKDLPEEGGERHEIVVHVEAAEVPEFGRSLLTNRTAESIVKQVVKNHDVDIVVTPFERHATRLRRLLREEGHESVPVKRPRDLDGTITDHAVVSFATANEDGIPRPPVTEPDVLYGLLSCARELTLVGNGETLRAKDFFRVLIESAEPYSES